MTFDMKTYDRLDPDDMSVSATDTKMGEMFCGQVCQLVQEDTC